MTASNTVDPAEPSAWPEDLTEHVESLATRVLSTRGNGPHRPCSEMRLETLDDKPIELGLRALLGDRPVLMCHATRLLPHEFQAIERRGVAPLTMESRSSRITTAIDLYGSERGTPDLEPLYSAGPLADVAQRQGRIGRIWAVSPMAAAFADDPEGLTPFLNSWGGESITWARKVNPPLATAIEWLTARSTPALIEIGVTANSISNTYQRLWPLLVAHQLGWTDAWQEYASTDSIAPTVATIITPNSKRWPLA